MRRISFNYRWSPAIKDRIGLLWFSTQCKGVSGFDERTYQLKSEKEKVEGELLRFRENNEAVSKIPKLNQTLRITILDDSLIY